MAGKANKAIIEITCGDFKGYFYPSRFGPAGKSLCVKLDNTENSEWMTPVEFEKKAGKGAQHNWKRTVRSVTHDKKTMLKCLQEGVIKICPNQIDKFDKDCKCRPCIVSKGGPVSGENNKSPESKVPAKKPTPIKNKKVSSTSSTSAISATSNTTCITTTTTGENSLIKTRDTDSDSGISIEISSNTATSITPTPPRPPTPMILEPLTTGEQEKPMPNYTLMVQEAIISLTKGEKNNENFQGCSLLGIFLYILRQYPNTMSHDSVMVMNTKIRSTLALLKRMGVVKSINDEPEDLEFESSLPIDVPKTDPTGTTKQELGEKIVKVKKESKPKQTAASKSNSNSLKSNSVAASTEATAKKKVSKNLVKKAKVFSSDKNSKSPNSPTSAVVVKIKSSTSKKSSKSNNQKIKKQKGSGKENSNKQAFSFAALKLKNLSPALALICGKSQMSRHEAVRGIWQYIKKHKLQDPSQKTVIFCDEKLKAVTKKKKVTCSEVLTCLTQNMTAI